MREEGQEWVLIIVLLLIAFVLFVFFTDQQKRDSGNPSIGYEYEFGGVVRPDDSGKWIIHNDATHEPTNLDRVETRQQEIEVFYKIPLTKIGIAAITAHRGLTEKGIICGTSIGTRSAIITCNKGDERVDMKSLRYPSFIWIYIKGYSLF